ncbi:hypothetical protein DVH05_000694 [Phytophthora capsici]|nr:hypothetical protein DVH05_000694 [Phytophthora capsici]
MEDDFIGARKARCEKEYVYPDDYDYNFVIPKALVTKLDAVVEAEKMKRASSKYFAEMSQSEHPVGTTEEIIAFFWGGTPRFTSAAVNRLKAFYDIRRKCADWMKDMAWLNSSAWERMLVTPELFDEETGSDELMSSEAGTKCQELAAEASRVLGNSSLKSMFRPSTGPNTVKVETLVGMLARDKWLNDAVIGFSIRCICNKLRDCYALDSLSPTMGYGKLPDERIANFNYVVLPVNLDHNHWGIIIIRLNYRLTTPSMTPYYYEPLCKTHYRPAIEDIYGSTVIPFLRDWHTGTVPSSEYPVVESGVWIEAPQQPDESSCGVLIIAHAYDLLSGGFRLSRRAVTPDDVAVMRLRILWIILMQPEVTTISNKLVGTTETTGLELEAIMRS